MSASRGLLAEDGPVDADMLRARRRTENERLAAVLVEVPCELMAERGARGLCVAAVLLGAIPTRSK